MLFRSILFIFLLIFSRPGIGQPEGRSTGVLKNAYWRLEFDKVKGTLEKISTRQGENPPWVLLDDAGRSGIVVRDVASGKEFRAGAEGMKSLHYREDRNSILLKHGFQIEGRPVELSTHYNLNGPEFLWSASLTGKGEGYRSLQISFRIPVGVDWHLWTQNLPQKVKPAIEPEPLSWWYIRAPEGVDRFDNIHGRHDLTLPLVSLIHEKEDLGLALSHGLEARQPSQGFRTVKEGNRSTILEMVTALVGLRGDKTLQVGGYFLAGRGCYRPALQWMLDKWPAYFLPEPGIYQQGGIYSIGSPWTGKQNPDGSYNFQGELAYQATFFEMHAHFPWYGWYFPEEPERAVWPDLNKIEGHQAREENLSLPLIRTRLANLARAGFHTYYYFAINDGYPPEVEKRWPDSIAQWPGRRPALSGWKGGGIDYRSMNADPAYSFGKDLVRQVDGIISQVKPLAGIFFDTVHHNGLDFVHDDGLTLVHLDGQSVPAYSLNFCYDFFLDQLSRKLRQNGQHLFINGPTAIRNARGVDAIMLEGEGDPDWAYEFENRRFLACLSRPLIWLFPSRPSLRREILLQRCLLYGAIPSAPPSSRAGFEDKARIATDRALWQPYLPLFELLRGRVLCFEPNPLRVPTSYRGELFTLPDHQYATVLINESMSAFDSENQSAPRITLRLKEKISSVKAFTPQDHTGRQLEGAYGKDGEFALEIPGFRGAVVLVLKPEEDGSLRSRRGL